MNIFEAIILGLVQGFTEFIPVSSSGHLLIGHEILGTSENSLGFDVALHVGTLLALLIFFRKDILSLSKNILSKNSEGRMARLILFATIPAVVAGLLFSDFIDQELRSPMVVAITLFLVGLLMIIADKIKPKKDKEIPRKTGLIVGLTQSIALIPGVSRSGVTITTGIFLGLERKQAARFSFLLAIPIITGSALGIFIKDGGFGSESSIVLIAGMLSAFISGFFAIKFMLKFISSVGLTPFAIYRFVLALIVLVFLV